MNRDTKHIQLIKGTLGNRLGIIVLSALTMLFFISVIGWFINMTGLQARAAFLLTSSVQNILLFIFPAWLAAFLASADPNCYLGITVKVTVLQFIGVVLLAVISMPAMNSLIEWNEELSLPDSMSALESTLRYWEDTAAATTRLILGDTSVWGLVSGILIIGVLTGFAEEMFFRAGIQNALTAAGWNRHLAIWLTAVLFSAVHFQFFGFFPRMLLGAAFGYIFYSTRSLWVAAFAHILNNSVVVSVEWLKGRGIIGIGPESWGTEGDGAWLWALASLVVTGLFIAFCWNKIFVRKKKDGKNC